MWVSEGFFSDRCVLSKSFLCHCNVLGAQFTLRVQIALDASPPTETVVCNIDPLGTINMC